MTTSKRIGIAVLLVLSLGLVAWGQQEDSDSRSVRPYGPYASITPGEPSETPATEGDEVTPDTHTVTGALPFTLGTSGQERSFLAPSFRYAQTMDSNGFNGAGLQAVSSFTGNLELQRVRAKQQMVARYTGGATFYETQSGLNSTFHQFGISENFQFPRWSLHLSDDFTYTPESSFGYSQLTGAQGSGVGPGFVPSQSILTTGSSRLSNTVLGQVDYILGPRSSLTGVVSYSMLRFPDFSLANSTQENFGFGYNYVLSAKNTLGVSYGLGLLRFGDSSRGINSHSLQVAYGRRITGRMALQVSGGPQISTFSDPAVGSGQFVGWAVQSSIAYHLRPVDLSVSYSHGVGGGGGVLSGATTDQVQAALSRRLTRTISGSLTAGYGHNADLRQLRTGLASQAFASEFVGINLTRPVGHNASAYLSYNLQHQSANAPVCNGGLCGNSLLRHVFGIGFEWHMRPILIAR